jgi:hypothetical protein
LKDMINEIDADGKFLINQIENPIWLMLWLFPNRKICNIQLNTEHSRFHLIKEKPRDILKVIR